MTIIDITKIIEYKQTIEKVEGYIIENNNQISFILRRTMLPPNKYILSISNGIRTKYINNFPDFEDEDLIDRNIFKWIGNNSSILLEEMKK